MFNKLFFLSLNEPSKKITKNENFKYSHDDREDISNCLERDFPPLFFREKYNAFWLDSVFCEHLQLFDSLYPSSKFILINEKTGDPSFAIKVLSYFYNESYANKYLNLNKIKYNDILLSDIEEPESSKFIILDDEEKMNSFLLDPITVESIHY